KCRKDAIPSILRGYREDSFSPPETKIEVKGEYTEKQKKECVSLIKSLINRIEDNGHPQVVKAATICGGLASYYGIEDLQDVLEEAIINNEYLSKNTKGYLRTSKELFDKGSYFPT